MPDEPAPGPGSPRPSPSDSVTDADLAGPAAALVPARSENVACALAPLQVPEGELLVIFGEHGQPVSAAAEHQA